jgi:hypothetical protein
VNLESEELGDGAAEDLTGPRVERGVEREPCMQQYSKPWCSARSGADGRTESSHAHVLIAVFSST